MSLLRTPDESPLYAAELAGQGYVPNYVRAFAARPEVYAAWRQLAGAVQTGLDLRRYELVTLTAARRLGSTYCTLAHGTVLRDRFYDDETLGRIVSDPADVLDPVDAAIVAFADVVATDPTTVTEAHVDHLRRYGLSDVDILDIVLVVCLRRFFSGVLSATGAAPDTTFDRLDPVLRATITAPR